MKKEINAGSLAGAAFMGAFIFIHAFFMVFFDPSKKYRKANVQLCAPETFAYNFAPNGAVSLHKEPSASEKCPYCGNVYIPGTVTRCPNCEALLEICDYQEHSF